MRIIIQEKEGRRFSFPIPYGFCINLAVREAWFRLAINHGGHVEEAQKTKYLNYLESIDFGQLRLTLKELGGRRGLVLVEVSSTDGTYFKVST